MYQAAHFKMLPNKRLQPTAFARRDLSLLAIHHFER